MITDLAWIVLITRSCTGLKVLNPAYQNPDRGGRARVTRGSTTRYRTATAVTKPAASSHPNKMPVFNFEVAEEGLQVWRCSVVPHV
jgi:hypothetical protein